MRTIIFHIGFSVCIAINLFSQDERGSIPVVNYPSSGGYRADRDVWCAMKSPSGTMYFGTSDDLLEYDGLQWKRHHLPHNIQVQSLTIDSKGRIFVCGSREIGYFEETRNGLQYTSLTKFIPDSLKEQAQKWTVDTLDGFVYLSSAPALLAIKDDSVHIHLSKDIYRMLIRYENRLLVLERGSGLMELKGKAVIPFDTSYFFKTVTFVGFSPAWNGKQFLFTKNDGLYLYDQKSVIQFPSPLNDVVKQFRPHALAVFRNGENIIATIGGGVIIFDSAGTILSIINKQNGLRNNTVLDVYDDGKGNVWLSTFEGVSKLSYPTALTIFSVKQKLQGIPQTVFRHKNRLYVGTVEKLFILDTLHATATFVESGTKNIFTEVKGITDDCSYALSVGKDLLVSTSQGVFVINEQGKKLVTKGYAGPLHRSQHDSNRIFVGSYGLSSLYYHNRKWHDEGMYENVIEDIFQVYESRPNVLWLHTFNQGILRVTVTPGPSRKTVVERFGIHEGLPSLSYVQGLYFEGKMRIPSSKGCLVFNEHIKRFEIDSEFVTLFPNLHSTVSYMYKGYGNTIWLCLDDAYRVELWEKTKYGTYQRQQLPFTLPVDTRVHDIYYDNNGVTWFSTSTGVYRYDPSAPVINESSYSTKIVAVHLIENDSLISHKFSNTVESIELPHNNNSVRVFFATNSFVDETKTLYRHRLEGYEMEWSVWSNVPYKEYTNISPGSYTFKVESQNVFGVKGTEASFAIRVVPAWWQTVWFQSCTVLIFIAAGVGIYKRRVAGLKNEKKKQQEFSRKSINLQEQERKRIAHELHDSISQSLLAIKNRASMAIKKPEQQHWLLEQLNIILMSSSGAIQEIKQITHNLRPYLLDRVGLTKALQALVRSFVDSSTMKLNISIDEVDGTLEKTEEIHLYRIAQEIFNNIQKHSQATEVQIALEESNGSLSFVVADNGKGFDTQATQKGMNSMYGFGLEGISERVRILQGEIQIISAPNRGTTISITIPIQKHTAQVGKTS